MNLVSFQLLCLVLLSLQGAESKAVGLTIQARQQVAGGFASDNVPRREANVAVEGLPLASGGHRSDEVARVNSADDRLANLLALLDESRFRVREKATLELIELGAPAIPVLARASVNASPEASRRIKYCLEEIGVRGDEDNLFRTMALLLLIYDQDSKKMKTRVEELRREWVKKTSEAAIVDLKKLGATVTRTQPDALAVNMLLMNQLAPPEVAEELPGLPVRRPKMAKVEVEKEIESILLADLKSNRNRVLGDTTLQNRAINSASIPKMAIDDGRLINGLANRQGRVGWDLESSKSQVAIEIGANWKGGANGFKLLDKIQGLGTLTLNQLAVDQELFRVLERCPLRQLEMNQCRIDDNLSDAKLPIQLSGLRMVKSQINLPLIEFIGSHAFNSLEFDDCTFSNVAVERLVQKDPARILELTRIPLTPWFLKRISKTARLGVLVLSGCKFELEAYKELMGTRKDLRVEFIPLAFLGVQSDIGVFDEKMGCIISNVVPDSAAADAGVRVGDRVTRLNKNSIQRFEDLRAVMSQFAPGEAVELEVERNGKRNTLMAKLKGLDDVPRF